MKTETGNAELIKMLKKMKVCPVLKNFTCEEKKILGNTKNKRVWLIATFFDQQINEAWSQLELKKCCLNEPKENHYLDPMESKGGAKEESLDQKILLLKHFSSEIENLVRGKERLLNSPDEYGYCQECGKAIPLERLEMIPQARLCVPCKEGR